MVDASHSGCVARRINSPGILASRAFRDGGPRPSRCIDLWAAIFSNNEEQIVRWKKFKGWYEHTVDLNGQWYLEVVEKLFKGNQLIKGELEVLGQKVDLKNITCPVFLLAGENDDITLPKQIFNMEKYVKGPVCKYTIENAGHIGVFIKTASLEYWKIIMSFQRELMSEAA